MAPPNAPPRPAVPWAEVRALFEAALEQPPAAREAALAAAPPELADEVRALLAQHFAEEAAPTPFLARPAQLQGVPELRGSRLGPWKLMALLGEGGMAEVWEAQRDDGAYEARVALKLLPPGRDGDERQHLLQQEVRALARLNHPHIARLLDAGRSGDGRPYFVMEAVDGRTLDEACRGLSLMQRLQLVLQLADAVSYAHRQGLVHRDLKPANVLVDGEGQIKLLDFGIAQALGLHQRPPNPGAAALTPGYASPEQVRGEPVGAASDVYALGVLLFVALTGVRPYGRGATTAAEALQAVLEEAPTPPSAAPVAPGRDAGVPRPQLRGDLDAVVLQALAKDASRRYGSVQALADDLRAVLERRPVSARPRTPAYVAARFVARHRSVVLASLLAGLALVGALGVTAFQARDALPALALVALALGAGLSSWQARRAARARDEARVQLAQTHGLVREVLMRYADRATFLPGGLQMKADLLTDTLAYLERLQQNAPHDSRLVGEIAKAYARLADMQLPIQDATLDQRPESEANTERALPLFPLAEHAHREDPDFYVWWSRALHCRASLDQLAGEPAVAMPTQQRRLGLLETALHRAPGHAGLRFERANALLAIGQLYQDTAHRPSLQQPEAALESFARAQAAYAELAEADALSGDAAFELGSVGDMQLQVLHGLGRLDEAREAGERAVAWRDRALALRPTHTAYRMGAVGVRNNLVSFLLNTGQSSGLEALALQGESLLHALQRDDPGQPLWTSRRRLLALNWGRALLVAGHPAEAVPRLEEAGLEMAEAVSGHLLVRRAIGLLALARAHAALGQPDAAQRHRSAALGDLQRRLLEDPADARARQCLQEAEALLATA